MSELVRYQESSGHHIKVARGPSLIQAGLRHRVRQGGDGPGRGIGHRRARVVPLPRDAGGDIRLVLVIDRDRLNFERWPFALDEIVDRHLRRCDGAAAGEVGEHASHVGEHADFYRAAGILARLRVRASTTGSQQRDRDGRS